MQLHYCCTTTTILLLYTVLLMLMMMKTTTTTTTTTPTIYDTDAHGTLPDLCKDWFIGYSSNRDMMMMMMMMMILISSIPFMLMMMMLVSTSVYITLLPLNTTKLSTTTSISKRVTSHCWCQYITLYLNYE